jgi:hypothetical protein
MPCRRRFLRLAALRALVTGGPAGHDSKGAISCWRDSRSMISASVWCKDIHSRILLCNNGLGNRDRASGRAQATAVPMRKETHDTAVNTLFFPFYFDCVKTSVGFVDENLTSGSWSPPGWATAAAAAAAGAVMIPKSVRGKGIEMSDHYVQNIGLEKGKPQQSMRLYSYGILAQIRKLNLCSRACSSGLEDGEQNQRKMQPESVLPQANSHQG